MKAGDIKLTKEQIKTICENISLGMPKKHALINAGVPESTFYQYLQQAEKIKQKKSTGKKLYRYEKMVIELSESLKKAESEYIKSNLEIIKEASKKTWQAASWLLERRYPEEFGRNDTLRLKGPIDIMLFDVPVSEKEMKEARKQLQLFLKKGYNAKEDYTNGQST